MSNTKEKASTNWHLTCHFTCSTSAQPNNQWKNEPIKSNYMNTIKSDISSWLSVSWLGCMRQCKIKLKTGSYSEQIQILILLPDKWSRNYCSEYFNVFEYLVWTHMKSKQKLEYQLNLLPEKEKLSPMKHFIW